MAITTFAELQTAAGTNWPNRSDLTVRVVEFIALAEANLRDHPAIGLQTITTDLEINAVQISLPSDFRELKSLYYSDTTTPFYGTIPVLAGPEALEEWRAQYGVSSGRPQYCAITEGATKIRFSPAPDVTYVATLEYYGFLQALSTTNTSNWLLQSYPNIYLYATLCEAEPYLKNDERLGLWKAKLNEALESLRQRKDRESFGGPLVIRPTLSLG
jgi:hypothetical protein